MPFGKNAKELAKIVIDMLLTYKDFIHSITSDNGKEFAAHKKITEKLVLQFFFAHPYSSLVRQYIPKKAVFENYRGVLKIGFSVF